MTDIEKLRHLYKQLKNIEFPIFEHATYQKIGNTVKEGVVFIMDWITNQIK